MSYLKRMLMIFTIFSFSFSFTASYKKQANRLRSFMLNFLRIVFAFSLLQTSHAATFTVLNTNDTGPDSLRFALFLANANSEDDTILFDPSLAHSTITLTSGEIMIGNTMSNYSTTITGPVDGKANSIIIDASGNSRIFNVKSSIQAELTLENLTLTGGNVVGRGGAILSSDTSLTLNDVVVTGNSATGSFPDGYGGGIQSDDADFLTLNYCVLSNNSADISGTALTTWSASTDVTINESLITGNTTNSSFPSGVSVLSFLGALFTVWEINNTTISNNHSSGISTSGTAGGLTINQSTISGNGVGIRTNADTVSITESTITNNTSSGLTHEYWGSGNTAMLNNSILAGNDTGGANGNLSVLGAGTGTVSVNHSLFGDDPLEITGDNLGAFIGDVPDLGPLQHNGGNTPTHRPNANSPVLELGNGEITLALFDQRGAGFPRIQNSNMDIGAVERELIVNGGIYEVTKRAELARAMLKAKYDPTYIPPPPTGMVFDDVQAIDFGAAWIEQLAVEGFTEGCAQNRFCPNAVVTREEVAKIILLASFANYVPDNQVGNFFNDNVSNNLWIKAMATEGLTEGCDTNLYCPQSLVTREWIDDGKLFNEL